MAVEEELVVFGMMEGVLTVAVVVTLLLLLDVVDTLQLLLLITGDDVLLLVVALLFTITLGMSVIILVLSVIGDDNTDTKLLDAIVVVAVTEVLLL